MHVFMYNNMVFYKLATFAVVVTQHIHRHNVITVYLAQYESLYMHNVPVSINYRNPNASNWSSHQYLLIFYIFNLLEQG